jgi:hypothetical protein
MRNAKGTDRELPQKTAARAEQAQKPAAEGRTTPNGGKDAEAAMARASTPASTDPLLNVFLALAIVVLLSTVLAMWVPAVLAILPVLLIAALLGASLAIIVIGLRQDGYTLGSISAYLREQREARQRFSPAWHRQESRRRLAW